MPPTATPEKPKKTPDYRARARKLVALAANNPEGKEAQSAALKACKLIAEHALLDLPGVQTAIPRVNVADMVDKTKSAAAAVREAAADPNVQTMVSSVASIFGAVSKMRRGA